MKKLRQTNVDTRGVAIYARKSRITAISLSKAVLVRIIPASSRQPAT